MHAESSHRIPGTTYEYTILCSAFDDEWPQRGSGVLPKADLDMTITPQAAGRSLRLEAQSARGAAWCAALAIGA